MRFSVITPNYNGEAYLEQTIRSVLSQRHADIDLEYIVVDGNSTDRSLDIIDRYSADIDKLIVENDTGPANAINKGFAVATGDVVSWLNADDVYFKGTLRRVNKALSLCPDCALCFGACPIIDQHGREIRKWITRFKELFFPFSGRFTYQCLNYISQPALFFSRFAVEKAGKLNENMIAAWDYDFILRLWREGGAVRVKQKPLAAFRWHEASISGTNFDIQFQEELASVIRDAGLYSPQSIIHRGVRWGIVGIYTLMAHLRTRSRPIS